MSSTSKSEETQNGEGEAERVRAQIELAEFVLQLVDSLSRETVARIEAQLDGTVWDAATAAAVGHDEVVQSKVVDCARAVRCCLESARTAQHSLATSVHRARLVRSVTLDDAGGPVHLRPGVRRVKVWRLCNSGSTRWPADCRIVQDGGEPCWDERSRHLCATEVLSGDEGDMSVVVRVPNRCGTFVTEWMLVDGESKPMLDQPLKWSFCVEPQKSSQSPPEVGPLPFEDVAHISKPVIRVTPLQDDKNGSSKTTEEKKDVEKVDVSKLSESEKAVFDAGFTDLNTIRALLAQNNGDASKVLEDALI